MEKHEALTINCKHGTGIASVVCKHLIKSEYALGFIENSRDPQDLQAWCFACEYYFLNQGEMTEAFKEFNQAVLVCNICYEELKEKHALP